MIGPTETELAIAEKRGRALAETAPRAIAARFDDASGRISIDLGNGCSYAFPPALVEDLKDAQPADLASVTVDGAGFNLSFPSIEVDLFVPSLVAGLFGTRAWMARMLASEAGRFRSPAKAAAARANGAKGGRPRKAAGA